MIFYSKSQKGFYFSDINKDMPIDAKSIDQETYQLLISSQNYNKKISFLTDPPSLLDIENEEIADRDWRNRELDFSDIQLNKLEDAQKKEITKIKSWRKYRTELRDWPLSLDFPIFSMRPQRPE